MSEGNKLLTQSTKWIPTFASPDLYIADFYLHYISDRVPDPKTDTLTDEQSYNKLMKVLGDLVGKAGSPAEKDYYRLYVTMFSRDWSNFRPLIERVLNNPESSKYFAYQSFNLGQLLIALGYQDQMITISKTLLQSDPSNGSLQTDLATALISKESTKSSFPKGPITQPGIPGADIDFFKSIACSSSTGLPKQKNS